MARDGLALSADRAPPPSAWAPPGEGGMAERVRARDWSASLLGPVDSWSPALRALAGVVLASPVPSYVVWGAGRTLLYNDAYAEVLQERHPAALGSDFLEVWGEVRGELEPLVARLYRGEAARVEAAPYTLLRQGRKEETFWSFTCTPVRDEAAAGAAAVIGFLCSCTEVTAQVESERRRREGEARLRGLLAGMGEGFALLDRAFRVTEVNAEGLRLDGRPLSELAGRHLLEAWPEAEGLPTWPLAQRALAEGRPGEARFRHRDAQGRDRWLEVRCHPAEPGLALFWRDVTEVERAGEAGRAAAERVELALDAGAILGTWLWDVPQDRYTADERFARTFGLDPARCREGVTRAEAVAAIHPEDRPRVEAAVAEALRRGGRYRCEYRVRGEGCDRWVEANGHVELGPDGAPRRFPGVLVDIGLRRQAEAERDRAAALLRESDERLRLALETAGGIGTWSWDIPGDRVFADAGFAAIYGVPPGVAAEGLPIGTYIAGIHPADREAVERAVAEAIATGGEFRAEYRASGTDGRERWLLARGRCLYDGGGRPRSFPGVTVDITERRAAEAALAASEARLRAIYAGSPVGLALLDRDLRYVEINERLADLNGFPVEAHLGRTVREVLGDYAEALEPVLRRALAGETIPAVEYEGESRGPPHEWRACLASFHPVRDAATGAVAAVSAAVLDITARRRAEAALEESRARLALAMEGTSDGIWDWDMATGRVYHSPRWIEMLGHRPEEWESTYENWLRHTHPEDVPACEDHLRRYLAGEIAEYANIFRMRHKDGRWLWMLSRAKAFRDEAGRLVRMVGAHTDITAQRAAEEELRRYRAELEAMVAERTRQVEEAQAQLAHARRMEALGQLAGGIAHDFNNVLQAVQGGAALLGRRPEDAEAVRRLAQMVGEAAARGAAITRRLLAFSRRGDLRAEAVDAPALLAGLREMLAHTLGAGIEVRVEAGPDLPPLLADKGQLETVLVNLAANARDAMGGQGTLTLSAGPRRVAAPGRGPSHSSTPAPGTYLRLSVADTGPGMPPEVLARATEPFFTTKPQGQGTGLGLAMARGFAEQSGGGLDIESEAGRGTCVSLWLPLAEEGCAGRRGEAPAVADPPPAPPRARVLVVDDDPIVLAVLAEQLAAAGHAVTTAGDGATALAWIELGEVVDVLVSDLSMPGMDGVALLRAAQRLRPALPAILLTGFATAAAEAALGEAVSGTFSLLRKPVGAGELAERVAVLLEAPHGRG